MFETGFCENKKIYVVVLHNFADNLHILTAILKKNKIQIVKSFGFNLFSILIIQK